MDSVDNTTAMVKANFESWFIIVNISNFFFLILAILIAIIFLLIVALNKTCHTVPIMLTTNSCLAEIVYGSITLSLAVVTFQNDTKQLVYQDALCTFRGYLAFVGTAIYLYSFTLQAIYRYISVVHTAHISWQSAQVQSMLIVISWILAIFLFLPWLFTGAITYSVDDQVCFVIAHLSVPVIYNMFFVYLIPVSIIVLIYIKLVKYVREMSIRATSTQTMFQARRDLVVVRRIIIIIMILLTLGFPYVIFILISFVTKPPKYHLRAAIFLVDLSQTLIMVAIFKFSQPVMDVILKYKRLVSSRVQPTMT
ncbi:unnamed protein product [Adineta steineri]|uniref:G-protein coupled receptors family 1 profile domain-containing protein n=1 Tax=Adineta steineri TaxID=433720 RepID=A0A814FHF7_9BILA|nr:unnamed protein product [Adineta steineri]CAF3882166.1 unnamed protein product [Adineta steineri]